MEGSEDEKNLNSTVGTKESPRNKEDDKSNASTAIRQSPPVKVEVKNSTAGDGHKEKVLKTASDGKEAKQSNGDVHKVEKKEDSEARRDGKKPGKVSSKGEGTKPAVKSEKERMKDSNHKENNKRVKIADVRVEGDGVPEKVKEVVDSKTKGNGILPEAKDQINDETSSVELNEGWKTAASSRTKVPKKKVVEPQKESLQKASRSERSGSTPPREAKAGSQSSNETWTQFQQDMLERGLAQYTSSSADRWSNIAKMVSGKSVVSLACRLSAISS